MTTVQEELVATINKALDRFANQLTALNDYLRRRDERIILSHPRLLQFGAADVGSWKQIANVNQYREGFAFFRTAAAGILYINTRRGDTATEGIPLGAGGSYPPGIKDSHLGELWVNPDAATIVVVFVEWVRTPLTPRQV